MPNLIVGSRGFIGQHFVELSATQSDLLIESKSHLVNLLQGVSSYEFDFVYWLAGSVSPSMKLQRPVEMDPDYLLLEKLLKSPLIRFKSFVFLSSGGCVYGSSPEALHESSMLSPINDYGLLKLACEKLIVRLCENPLILRVSNVHGPNQPTKNSQGVISHWLKAIANHEPITIYGSLESYRDFIHVDDVVNALMKSSEIHSTGIFNIGSGEKTTLGMIVNLLESAFDDEIQLDYRPSRETDRLGYVLDVTKARKFFDWKPKMNSTLSISSTIDHFMKSFHLK